MASIFHIAGRLYGRAIHSKPVAATVKVTGKYVLSEMKLTDVRLRAAFLRKKFQAHLTLLGRTAYRIAANGGDPVHHPQVETIFRVLGEIEYEIAAAEGELERRRTEERAKWE